MVDKVTLTLTSKEANCLLELAGEAEMQMFEFRRRDRAAAERALDKLSSAVADIAIGKRHLAKLP